MSSADRATGPASDRPASAQDHQDVDSARSDVRSDCAYGHFVRPMTGRRYFTAFTREKTDAALRDARRPLSAISVIKSPASAGLSFRFRQAQRMRSGFPCEQPQRHAPVRRRIAAQAVGQPLAGPRQNQTPRPASFGVSCHATQLRWPRGFVSAHAGGSGCAGSRWCSASSRRPAHQRFLGIGTQ